jgi:hypothetical protein
MKIENGSPIKPDFIYRIYEELDSCFVIEYHLGFEGFFSGRSFPECDEHFGFIGQTTKSGFSNL